MAVSLNQKIAFQGNDNKNYIGSAAKGAVVGGVVAAGATKLLKPTGGIDERVLADAGIDTAHNLRSLGLNIKKFANRFKDNLTLEAKTTIKTVSEKVEKTLKGIRTPELIAKTRETAVKSLQEGTKKYGRNVIVGAGVGAAAFLALNALKSQKDE